jgi:hypothetical protein
MAHFAQIDENNIVLQVIVVDNNELLDENGIEQETKGREFCSSLLGGTWIQTSYNSNFRKNFAGIGFMYDLTKDAFIQTQPYPSWVLNQDTCIWEAPVPYPSTGGTFTWNETEQTWDTLNIPRE